MKIIVHIGPDGPSTDRLQRVLHAKRDQLKSKGVLYARTPGAKNHTRLFMAVSAPEAVDTLRFNRGFITPEKQAALRAEVAQQLANEVAQTQPETLILSAHQLGSNLTSRHEINTLKDLLSPLSEEIEIIGHIGDPARMLVARYCAQLLEGRARPLDLELGLLDQESWWEAALATHPAPDLQAGRFSEVQGAVHWLDFARLQQEWEAVFGAGSLRFRVLDLPQLYSEAATEEIRAAFGIRETIGKAEPERQPVLPSAAWMARCRQMNDVLLRFLAQRETILPRQLWRKMLGEIKVHGAPIDPGSLHPISERFGDDLATLAAHHPGLDPARLAPAPQAAPWQEADPTLGFRATQYLMAFRWRIAQASKEAEPEKASEIAALADPEPTPAPKPELPRLSPWAERYMPDLARQNVAKLQRSPFKPHNRLGRVREDAAPEPYAPRQRLEGRGGNIIVGCMKNEAPYIVEWVAYHRAVGFDDFLIYSNGCEDGTSELLERLQAMGVLQHRNNDDWKGKSPQQHALDLSLKEPVLREADWIAHIDVDEFVNIRCGNGTLSDLFERVPDASNIAMTWRLFGYNGVRRLEDRLVIEQFDTCAPKYCPKPHTVWGFKTLFRNIGAYGKISCHRPNKLAEGFEDKVKWVNGSGADMTQEALRNGWRNSKKTIGYDLVQLNHYALRSAESFLIKRQRGRALHVDRSIGLNYWIRMDWGGARDLTIKRNIPRVRAEIDRLLGDPELRRLHEAGLAWHKAKAEELHATPEFEDLYQQALALRLTETERVAYALALDLES
ncbi:glycosyltransferase family 2 protein [Salipiger bermudensis]|uniref:glycosyltransferase family 2 protein n=1 Tax=Salipiger bermudensis TaxID=344736 RepID=UPI001C99ED69|nr:glycosyltransferase family 2 protein [Salipiger bermudensis]MBY6005795.1 glycosyltransferase family 2 protein [Salipiger bermudensis]